MDKELGWVFGGGGGGLCSISPLQGYNWADL